MPDPVRLDVIESIYAVRNVGIRIKLSEFLKAPVARQLPLTDRSGQETHLVPATELHAPRFGFLLLLGSPVCHIPTASVNGFALLLFRYLWSSGRQRPKLKERERGVTHRRVDTKVLARCESDTEEVWIVGPMFGFSARDNMERGISEGRRFGGDEENGPVFHETLQLGEGFFDLGDRSGAVDELPLWPTRQLLVLPTRRLG